MPISPSSNYYRGHSLVNPEEVFRHYGGTHVPMHVMDRAPSGSRWKLIQFLDNFSIPEATLFADVLQVHTCSEVVCIADIIHCVSGLILRCFSMLPS